MPTRKKSAVLSERDRRLRELGEQRLEKLREQEERILRHLETDRGKNDHQALRYLLHQVEVERHDLYNNLRKDEQYVPKPGKAQRGRRQVQVIEKPPVAPPEPGPAPQPSKYAIPRPVPGSNLPKFASRYTRHEERTAKDQGGRSWTSAPFVEVQLPVKGTDKIISTLRKFSQKDERSIVRDWARNEFGSIQQARESLRGEATISDDVEDWRSLLAETRDAREFESLTDEEIRAAISKEAKSLRIRRAALLQHRKDWVSQTIERIKASAPEGTHKDTLDSLLRAGLRSFHTATNSDKHTNPQFPYLTSDHEGVDVESVVEHVKAFLDDPDDQRYLKKAEDDQGRYRVTALQKELGKALPRRQNEIRRHKWGGKRYFQGVIKRRRDASLVWDTTKEVNGLALALPIGGFPRIDADRFIYQDGTSLLSDYQLANKNGRGKACAVLQLKLKHDFLRWYAKHVENHNPDAPLERRCIQNTLQFVVVDPEGPNPRLFIRPVFKFYEPRKSVPDTHTPWKKPRCRYLIGIDRGVNYVLRAVVVDTECNKVIRDIALRGRKDEWRKIREEIAYHQRKRDIARNRKAHPTVVAKHVRALALARKKDRALGKFETVEAVAKLVELCEQEYGSGNYCFVLEDLEVKSMNLRRDNRVKHLAAVREALVNQMRKRGYAYNDKSGKVDSVRFEGSWYTSQISPFGWWAKREEVEEAWKQDKTRPIGRRVGKYYERPTDDRGLGTTEVFRRGRWTRQMASDGKRTGRNRFCVEPGDESATAPPRHCWGSELFWDPYATAYKGREFREGLVLEADFVGAFNIALRPLVKDGQGKGFGAAEMAQAHTVLNPQFAIDCKIPVYAFEELNGDPRGALRRLVL